MRDDTTDDVVDTRQLRLSRTFGRCLLACAVAVAGLLFMVGRANPSARGSQNGTVQYPGLFETVTIPPSTSTTVAATAPVTTAPAPAPAAVTTSQSPATPTTAATSQNLSAAVAALWRTQSSGNVAIRVGGQVVSIVTTRPRTISKGTGMVLTPDGLVLTNSHVVEDAGTIDATVGGTGPKYKARVIGTDPTHDIAVIQLIGAAGLPVVTIGGTGTVSLGATVQAVGNAASGATPLTATSGIVVELGHTLEAANPGHPNEVLTNLIAFVAPVEAGDSGGPLINGAGDVVGMVTAGGLDPAGVMIGYAIPIQTALDIANQLAQ
jgi:S1-C subfamily serine protease